MRYTDKEMNDELRRVQWLDEWRLLVDERKQLDEYILQSHDCVSKVGRGSYLEVARPPTCRE